MPHYTSLVWLFISARPLASFQVDIFGASSSRTPRRSTTSHERWSHPHATTSTTLSPTADSSSAKCVESSLQWRRRRAQLPWYYATTTALSMCRGTELQVSPRETDGRTVQEWLQFDEQELSKIRGALQSVRACDVDERLGLVADGKTDSILVSWWYGLVSWWYGCCLR